MTPLHRRWLFLLCAALAVSALSPAGGRSTLAEEKPAAEKSLAEELPRIKAVEPAEALKTFAVQNGFRLQLVAAEPSVSDPVDACFDADGRMYVAEMHGYPYSQEPTRLNPQGGGKKNAGIVRLLEDTDGDGTFDRSVKFADGIIWPTSVCCYDGGVFVLAPPNLHYFKDTNGDDVADIRRVVFTGFNRDNVQSLANNMKWGLDGRITVAGGRNPSVIQKEGRELLKLGNVDFRFDPRTETVEPVTGGVQFGHSFDDWGNRFVCSNSNHIQHVVFPYRYQSRNPYFAVSGAIRTIAKEGAAGPVYRTSPAEPWRIVRTRRRVSDPEFVKRASQTEQFATGFFTSATGVTIYRGNAYPPEFRGNAFIGDVGGNLVHRKTLEPAGASVVATRADRDIEFITSTDNWFRPVNFVNAPDGTLFILDMYRETIEHPFSIPEDIKVHLNLESGADRGRIYRLLPPVMKQTQPPKLAHATTAELVVQLESENAWNRETAQRLLWERQDKSAAGPLRTLVETSASPLARMHALHTLDGLSELPADLLVKALRDVHEGVREHAVLLSEKQAAASPAIVKTLTTLTGDPAYRVRFQLAFTLGEIDDERAVAALGRMARNPENDGDIRTALMTSVYGKADRLTLELMNDAEFVKQPASLGWFAELARIVGADRQVEPAQRLLAAATLPGRPPALQQTIVSALGEGLNRRGASVSSLLAAESTAAKLREQVQELFRAAATTAGDEKRPLGDRQAAVTLLAFADTELAAKALPKLLSPLVPQSLQLAAVDSLSNQTSADSGRLLVAGWKSYSPQVRRDVVDALLRSNARIEILLGEVDAKRIQPADIERDKKQLLTNHPDSKLRDRAKAVLGGDVSPDRAKIVAEFQTVLDLDGDLERGRQVFEKRCSVCHRVGNVGHQVAPELSSVQNKSVGDLVIAILDPNREAQPNFTTYTVVTAEGRIVTGIIAAETANSLTLRRAEAKEDVVLRSNIDTLVSNGKSLMPEGLEKDIGPQQLADVIAFVKSIRPEAKSPAASGR